MASSTDLVNVAFSRPSGSFSPRRPTALMRMQKETGPGWTPPRLRAALINCRVALTSPSRACASRATAQSRSVGSQSRDGAFSTSRTKASTSFRVGRVLCRGAGDWASRVALRTAATASSCDRAPLFNKWRAVSRVRGRRRGRRSPLIGGASAGPRRGAAGLVLAEKALGRRETGADMPAHAARHPKARMDLMLVCCRSSGRGKAHL
mmetsp:Transcript_17147/g.45097  ORF Transcript_17147/g.45097 Transcript_17147/m.45097 type:complete len:207 (+) Transcript_17147:1574-2194(+)